MHAKKLLILVGTVAAVGVLAFVFAAALWRMMPQDPAAPAAADDAPCMLEAGPCEARVGGRTLTLEVAPRPVPAFAPVELTLTVSEPGAGGPQGSEEGVWETLSIDLQMPGMAMGENRVTLHRAGPNRWQGQGVVPACPSGHTLWEATVAMPDGGSAAFQFHTAEGSHGER